MSRLRCESPLNWPDGQPATPRASQRNDHGFQGTLSLEESIGYLDDELSGLQSNAVLSLDVEQPLSGRLRKKTGSRTGAALHLKYHGRNYVVACDRWQTVEANVYALHLALRHWRNMERWGIAAFPVLLKGFEPGQRHTADIQEEPALSWMQGLGLGTTATLEDAIAVYHRRAKQAARDSDALVQLNQMMEQARAHFNKSGG